MIGGSAPVAAATNEALTVVNSRRESGKEA
jgi:hypothetical protein